MGVLNRGILGGFRGSVGPVTGTSWKGIDVMKSKPLSVANPKTPGQVSQRNKFSGAVALAVAVLASIVKPLWDRFAQRQSGYNAFVSANIDNFDSVGDIVDPADVIISEGTLDNLGGLIAQEGANPEDIGLIFNTNGGFPTDTIYVMVINRNTGTVEGFDTGDTRNGGPVALTLSEVPSSGDDIDVYVATRTADGTNVSNTQYKTYAIA